MTTISGKSSSSIIIGEEDARNESVSLPNQRVSRKIKNTKKWQEDTINYYINNRHNNQVNRKSKKEIINNWDFYNNYLSSEELKKHLDPLNVENSLLEDESSKFSFYNILDQPFDTLFGEELKRTHEVKAYAINQDIINEKDKEFKSRVSQYFTELVQSEQNIDKEALQKKLAEYDEFKRYDLQSAHEIMINNILNVLRNDNKLNLKGVFNKGFKDLQINAESIYKVGNVGKELSFTNVQSSNFYVYGMGKSNYIHDGVAWVEEVVMSPNKIIEEFAEELTNTEIDIILSLGKGGTDSIDPMQIALIDIEGTAPHSTQALPLAIDGEFLTIDGTDNGETDGNGNLRVFRLEFMTLRKLGKLNFIDQEGYEQSKWVDEEYLPNIEAGENIEWIWVNEIMRGARIGNDIFKKIGVSPVQMRSIVNPAIVRPSYVGYVIGNNGVVSKSRIEKLQPYQRMYNLWMNKLVQLWSNNLGKVGVIDVSRIPSDMDTDEWYMWIKKFHLMYENPFEQGKKGAAKGLISGNMQQNSKVIDLSLAEEINSAVQTLSWIENRVNKIAAIPEPRQGNLTGNEGLGTSQQAIIQSSHQTEGDFFVHDLVKAYSYEVIIEYIKVLWKDEKTKRQFVLDDLSNYLLDIDGGLINEGEYGIAITNSSKLTEMHNALKTLIQPAMQNGASLSEIAKMLTANSSSKMVAMLEENEDKKNSRAQQLQEAQAQAQTQALEAQAQLEETKHKQALELLDKEWNYKLQERKLELQIDNELHSRDNNQNKIEDSVELEKEQIKADSDEKLQTEKLIHEKELKQMEIDGKLKIEDKKTNKNK